MAPQLRTVHPHHASEHHHGKDHTLFLDVRTPSEYDEAHIHGSVLHPLTDLNIEEIRTLAEGKKDCLLVCRSGNRARQAAQKLAESGLSSVCVLEGGVQAWEAAGLPLRRGTRKVMSLERQVRIAAGSLVAIGTALAAFVNPLCAIIPGFVGCGLVFAGVTDTCAMGMLIARLPWNTRRTAVADQSCCTGQSSTRGSSE